MKSKIVAGWIDVSAIFNVAIKALIAITRVRSAPDNKAANAMKKIAASAVSNFAELVIGELEYEPQVSQSAVTCEEEQLPEDVPRRSVKLLQLWQADMHHLDWERFVRNIDREELTEYEVTLEQVFAVLDLSAAVRCLPAFGFSDSDVRAYLVWCARQVLPQSADHRASLAVDVAALYADGEATKQQLCLAWHNAVEAVNTAYLAPNAYQCAVAITAMHAAAYKPDITALLDSAMLATELQVSDEKGEASPPDESAARHALSLGMRRVFSEMFLDRRIV